MQAAATYSPKALSASGTIVRLLSQSISRATHCSASSGLSGIGAMAPTAHLTPRLAGSRTTATDATERPGPVLPVAFRKTCGACSRGTRTKPMSSPPRSISTPASRCDTGISRRAPPWPAMISVASRAASTGSASPVGAAEAMLPPRVPALRIWGGPAARAEAASAGMSAAKSGRPMRACVRPAPSSACPSWYCQPRISLIRPRPTSALGLSWPELTAAMRSVPPATERPWAGR